MVDGFAATDSYAIGKLEPEKARDAFARIDRPEIDAFVVPGRQFPDDGVDRRLGARVQKARGDDHPGVQSGRWRAQLGGERMPGFGRLLEEMPAG